MVKINYMMTVDDVTTKWQYPKIQKKEHGLHRYGWRTGWIGTYLFPVKSV